MNARTMERLNRSSWVAILLLVLIYLLGMYTNLFIAIPEDASAWRFAMSSGIVLSHIILGTLLIFHAASISFMAFKAKSSPWILSSIIGLIGILLSITTGSSFIMKQTEMNSFLMAIGLGVSILAYSTGMYLASSVEYK